jgi:multicomponent Na+:H+ antiporter subunit E
MVTLIPTSLGGVAVRFRTLGKTAREIIPLALLLFVLWLIFTAKTDWRNLLLGAVVSLLFAAFSYYLLGGRLDPHLNVGVAIRFPIFATLLFWEIIKANWDVIKRVLAPSLPISPRIVAFQSYLESDIAKTVLANSITLTPGTVTVDIQGSRFFIHCLAKEHSENPGEGKLQRMTAWLFREGPSEMRGLK